MGKKRVLVTGSCGLVGSEIVSHFSRLGWSVVGADNNMRRDFFGQSGDTTWNLQRLQAECPGYEHHVLDIRDRTGTDRLFAIVRPDLLVHAAAQPSHDLAARRPFDDFDINATGTLNLLEATRRHRDDCVFVHLSTNKVYGDRPNELPLVELETRWDYADPADHDGIDEAMSIDHSMHSLFGTSKAAADLLVQEYGRYFGMATCCLRGGCLTGPNHSGVELHGFLSYLVKCNLERRGYTVFGYKGKQVRDNIHSQDVARCIEQLFDKPAPGLVFNLGGGRANSISILEAFEAVEQLSGIPMKSVYVAEARRGDHICYISNLAALEEYLPDWRITRSLNSLLEDVVEAWVPRLEAQ